MCEIKLWRAEKCELTVNVCDSREMLETWQGCCLNPCTACVAAVEKLNIECQFALDEMAGTQLINLSSADGAKLLTEVQSGHHGSCYQSKLIDIFTKQVSRSSCGLVSCGLVLSAYGLGQGTSSKPAYTEDNMFSMPATMTAISEESMNADGKNCVFFPIIHIHNVTQPCGFVHYQKRSRKNVVHVITQCNVDLANY